MGRAFIAIATAISVILIISAWGWLTVIGILAVLAIAGFIGSRRLRTALDRKILDRCEKQHTALMRGNEDYGIYGLYPPPETGIIVTGIDGRDYRQYIVKCADGKSRSTEDLSRCADALNTIRRAASPPPPRTATTMTDEPWVNPCTYRNVWPR